MNMRPSRAQIRFRATAGVILPGAGETLFRNLGLPLLCQAQATDPDLGRSQLSASVAFSGERAVGTLAIFLPVELARRLLPTAVGSIEDWVGELANQLTGRLVNRLTMRGLVLRIATPTVRWCTWDRAAPQADALVWEFRLGDDVVWVAVSATVDDGFCAGTPVSAGAIEGQLVVFQ